MAERFQARGTTTDFSTDTDARTALDTETAELKADFGLKVELLEAIDISPAGRAGGADITVEAQDDNVIEAIDSNEWTEYVTAGRLRKQSLGAGTRQTGPIDLVAVLGSNAGTRGVGELRRLSIFDVKFPDKIQGLRERLLAATTRAAARQAAIGLVDWIEQPDAQWRGDDKKKPSGLYRVDDELRLRETARLGDDEKLSDCDDPYLVLIHGTFSNAESAFGGLRGTDEWRRLVHRYEDRIVALEHNTLAVNPAQNALDLARQLPRRGRLHVVSHSRGGLVGGLLSLASHDALDPSRFKRPKSEDFGEVDLLEALASTMAERSVSVERFARVASPSGGTTLASETLDKWAGFLLNGLKLIPGAPDAMVGIVKTFLLTFLDQRTEPDVIPGIEAQIPRSPFIDLINAAPSVADDFAAIAGDVEPGIFSFLAVKGADLFYGADHDYVVDTRSMYQGAQRERGAISFHWGKDVNHFRYFKEAESRSQLAAWLERDSADNEYPTGFDEIDRDAPRLAKPTRLRASTAGLPTVIIVPDFMGTTLVDEKGVVWPAPARLSRDGIGGLRTSSDGVVPGQLLERTYQPLIDTLEASYRVILFPYDWRDSLARVADALAKELGRWLENDGSAIEPLPVHVVGHGFGGLAARLLRSRSADTWRRIRDRNGRVILLGVPNLGTHRSVQLATGDADVTNLLRLLDPTQSQADIARMFRSYPVVLETLPRTSSDFWSTSKFWSTVKWPPNQQKLNDCHAVLNPLDRQQPQDGVLVSIAGIGQATPDEVKLEDDAFVFGATHLGDGAVTSSSAAAIPDTTYHLEVSHGELPNDPRSVSAVVEVLRDGATPRLRTEPEVVPKSGTMPAYRDRQLYPTARSLEEAATGTVVHSQTPTDRITIQLDVSHGDLSCVGTPVLVGHYAGSTLAGAELALDKTLDGRLSERDILGLYPGEVGEAAYVLSGEDAILPAGLIVGLGEINDITAAKVITATTEGCLRYAIAELDKRAASDRAAKESEPGIALSTVLLGSYGPAGLSIEGSLAAIVKGVIVANQRLAECKDNDIYIDRIHVIELYEDLAVEAVHAAHGLHVHLGAPQLGASIVPNPYLQVLDGAQPGQPGLEYEKGDWRPIVVESVPTSNERCPRCSIEDKRQDEDRAELDNIAEAKPTNGTDANGRPTLAVSQSPSPRRNELERDLVFTSIGNRARAEEAVQSGQRELLERLMSSVVDDCQPEMQTLNTLYELLLPKFLKGQSRETNNLLWVLDADASRYPWEMLAAMVGDHIEPLAAEVGMLRRLATRNFREGVTSATGNQVLVIGDPATDYARLPGAREEARRVADQLSAQYQVTTVISEESDSSDRTTDILNALFAHDYRIVHIASHGDYNARKPACSGAVIGPNNMFLTAMELKQLRTVPPLVFLNCCHLGRIGSLSNLFGHFHRFASSVSEQLIADGVRAVVAAGWAVRDDAASDFAALFYGSMLEGRPFGESVRVARREIYQGHKDTNTWGAYQCYGDPGFRLTSQRRFKDRKRQIRSRAELKAAVARIAVDAKGDEGDEGNERTELTTRLDAVLRTTPKAWHGGDVMYEAGKAFGELREFARAIDMYKLALSDWGARAPLDVLEELANLEARLAVERERKDSDTNQTDIDSLLESAAARLIQLKQIGETPERHALVGSYHHRRARLARYRTNSVKAAESAYRHASELYERDSGGAINPYYAINWATFRGLRGNLSAEEIDKFEGLLTRALAEARRRNLQKPEIWNRLAIPDAELARGLILGDLPERVEAVFQGYEDALKKRSSPRERESVFDHIDLIAFNLRYRRGDLNESQAEAAKKLQALLVPRDDKGAAPDEGPLGALGASAENTQTLDST